MGRALGWRGFGWWTRWQVGLTLGRIRDPRGNRMQAMRQAADAYMGSDRRVLEVLVDVLRTDRDSMTRGCAAGLLGEFGDRLAPQDSSVATRWLLHALRNDGDHFVRFSAAKALAALGVQPDDPAQKATQAALLSDLETLTGLARGSQRLVAVEAAAAVLADDLGWRLIPFLCQFGSGSPAAVDALERFVAAADELRGRSRDDIWERVTGRKDTTVNETDSREEVVAKTLMKVLVDSGEGSWEVRLQAALEALEVLRPTLQRGG